MKFENVIVSPSVSVAVIFPTTVPSELFSFILDSVWLLIVGCTLSVTVIVIGRLVIELVSCPDWKCSSEAVIEKLSFFDNLDYKTYKPGMVVPQCGECFWCEERNWGKQKAGIK